MYVEKTASDVFIADTMIILKPAWISHNGMPIFSVDIHPDGTRLATGGQGPDSGLVMVWNTAAMLDENNENDENVPKILCQVCAPL